MDDLMPIGRFAEVTELTVKALRLYDKLGILRPAFVDFHSGYRYYSADQIPTAQRIRLLRTLDMPLDEIRGLLAAEDASAVRARMAMHRQRVEQRIQTYRDTVAHLRAIERTLTEQGKDRKMDQPQASYHCSFCGKNRVEVYRMIAGPKGVFICSECIDLCNEIIAREKKEEAEAR